MSSAGVPGQVRLERTADAVGQDASSSPMPTAAMRPMRPCAPRQLSCLRFAALRTSQRTLRSLQTFGATCCRDVAGHALQGSKLHVAGDAGVRQSCQKLAGNTVGVLRATNGGRKN